MSEALSTGSGWFAARSWRYRWITNRARKHWREPLTELVGADQVDAVFDEALAELDRILPKLRDPGSQVSSLRSFTGGAAPYIAFFVPPGAGGGAGGVPAKNALGDDLYAKDYLAEKPAGDRSLAQGLKGDAT